MLSGPVTRISSSSFLKIWRRRERGADRVRVAVSQCIQALDLPTGDAQVWRERLYRILVNWFHHAAQAAAWREGHLGPLSPRAAEHAKAPQTDSRSRQSTAAPSLSLGLEIKQSTEDR
jgi:hypothetical protein